MSKALDIAATLREALADMEANGNPAREARIGVVALEAILSELERLGRKEAAASLRFFDIDYRVEGCGRERLMAIADFDLSTDTAAAALVVAEERECYADDVEIVDVQERDLQRAVTKAREAAREAASSDHIDLGYEDIVADAIIDACQRSLVEQGLLLVPREAAWVLERLGPRQKKKGDAGG